MIDNPQVGDYADDDSADGVAYICYESKGGVSVWYKGGEGFAAPVVWRGPVPYRLIVHSSVDMTYYWQLFGVYGRIADLVEESLWTADW